MLFQQLDSMIDRIRETGISSIVKAEFRYFSGSTMSYNQVENQQFHIPPSVLQFYKEIDFVELSWHIPDGMLENYLDKELDIPGGFAHIPTFDKLLVFMSATNKVQLIDPTQSFSNGQQERLNSFVPFDFLESGGAICFRVQNNQLEDNLFLVKTGIDCLIAPLYIGCLDYTSEGCKHYFFNDWQQSFYLKDNDLMESMKFYLDEIGLKTF